MSPILLGIDIGTSACKVVAFDTYGSVLAQASENYPVYYPQAGWVEQDPEQWWEAVCGAIAAVIKKGVDPKQICGIGIDGQSWSAIPIDKNGTVLCNTPIWMDTRALDICEKLKQDLHEDTLFASSGNPVQPMYTMPKVLWYKKHYKDIYDKADKILQSNGFIAFRLTEVATQDPSQGYGWNCFNTEKCQWDFDLCDKIGIRRSLLPDIMACHAVIGTVTEQAAAQTGLCVGTPVVAGGLDAACGALGVGVIHAGETQEQGGQAGGMSICIDQYTADKRLILGAHVVPNLWLLQGGTVGGASALNWFEQEFGAEERALAKQHDTNSFMEIDTACAGISPTSDGITFLPYLAGERSPIWDANAKGVFYGIDFSKTRHHFARAVMESVAYALRHNLEVAETAGAHTDTLRSMGGAANSALWMQIKADVTGKHIVVPSADTATALGAAILAGVGVGVFEDFSDAVKKTIVVKKEYFPCEENQAIYNKGYTTYRKLYDNLKTMMNEG